ncbi:flavin-containing monooxygenase [Bradyrhizobium elkanii]|uniref:flavin-containing monooxygenase n=1 Tax=Bradyrhizobium elkanii TaxID=29448 RepID=UPI0035193688
MTGEAKTHYEVIVVGAGVAGIYQIKRLADLGIDATVLEAAPDLGGTWYWNRYPGCRFDSESYTYGFSFSRELLDEWHWKERFSGQPENLRYLNYVADKFDLRKHMQFNCKVETMQFDETRDLWQLRIGDGRELTCRFVVLAIGLLSAPTMPRVPGIDDFKGRSFHTYYWPHEPVDLAGKKVAVIGTGATGIQLIGEIADKVGELTVFQRRPNWSAPLNNSAISDQEMADIRARYDEIFAACALTPGSFVHGPDKRGFYEVSREERLNLWDKLYDEPGFGIWLANFREIFMDEAANAELSEYIAGRIRQRVNDPDVAEKLIPRDHGFGVQRLPLETRYFEAYNRDNVQLVDLSETPLVRVTEKGLRTTARDYDFDIIVYATGFDAITGAYDLIDIRGNRRRAPRRQVEARAVDLPRHARARLPEPVDADRTAKRLRVDELPARHRERRQLVHQSAAIHVGPRPHPRRRHAGGAAALDRACRQDVRDHADAQSQVVVHRLQLQRRRPRGGHRALLRLQRRYAEVFGDHQRGRGGGVSGDCVWGGGAGWRASDRWRDGVIG